MLVDEQCGGSVHVDVVNGHCCDKEVSVSGACFEDACGTNRGRPLAFFQIERGHPISRFVDLSRFQLCRDTVPIAINVGTEFSAAKARQLLQAYVAGDGFDVAC